MLRSKMLQPFSFNADFLLSFTENGSVYSKFENNGGYCVVLEMPRLNELHREGSVGFGCNGFVQGATI